LQIPNFTLGVGDDKLFEEVVDIALTAENAGFSSVWVMDHFYQLPPLGGPDMPMLEGYTLLGALGARTTKVELGTLVTGVTYRNPAILAKIVTTLDIITSGRAILGIGAAWYDVEHEGLGVEFPPVKERMDRLEEAVQICKLMFTEDKVSFDGRYYSIKEARNLPRPVRPTGIPIMIGGGGEKRTLKAVAKYADMCNVVGDVAGIRHKIDVIQRHCKDVGRDPSEVAITRMATLVITDSDEQTKQTMDFLVSAAGPEAASAFNVGREDEIVDQIGELAEAGVDTFIFNMPTSGKDAVQRAGELFASRWG
jgi:F420-dependent oxidoreductase-like protein